MKEEIINKIRDYCKDKPIKKAYLFGSYARGDYDETSDIDILVDLDYSQRIGMQFFGWHADLQEIFNKKVDLVTTRALSKFIKPYVDSDKELVYEKENIKQGETATY